MPLSPAFIRCINMKKSSRILPLAVLAGLFNLAPLHAGEIIDQNNRTVALPNEVQNIVGITVPSASMVITLDQDTERLKGMNPIAKRQIEDSLMSKMFPQSLEVPGSMAGDGFAPNVEAILAAKPDIIFQWGDKGESILKPLETLGIPVVTFKYGKTKYVKEWIDLTGKSIDRQQRAERLLGYFTQTEEALKDAVNQHHATQKPRVLFVFRYKSGLQVGGLGTSMHTDIERAGGINVAANVKGFKTINIEQLLEWNPDIILLTNFENGLSPDSLYGDPLLKNISAIKQQRVYQYPKGGFVWEPPSQESPLTWRWLYSVFYQSNELDTVSHLKNYYQLLYNYSLSEAEIQQVLRFEQNQGSSSYSDIFNFPKQPL